MAKEKIYTIPVMDAYKMDCSCPICEMYKKLERDKVDFLFDTAYMEDDIRSETNRLGFCHKHYHMINLESNRLGLALILQTHLSTAQAQIQKKIDSSKSGKRNKKAKTMSEMVAEISKQCYICETVDVAFQLYLDTVFYLYKKDDDFKTIFNQTKGYCMKHFAILFDMAPKKLKGAQYDSFISALINVYDKHITGIQDNIDWFVKKFDYRYKDEPWKDAKTAIFQTLNVLTEKSEQ